MTQRKQFQKSGSNIVRVILADQLVAIFFAPSVDLRWATLPHDRLRAASNLQLLMHQSAAHPTKRSKGHPAFPAAFAAPTNLPGAKNLQGPKADPPKQLILGLLSAHHARFAPPGHDWSTFSPMQLARLSGHQTRQTLVVSGRQQKRTWTPNTPPT
jgi:hypothetical protein